MSPSPQADHRNLLLRRIEPGDYATLAPQLETFREPLGALLLRPDQPVEHVFFPTDGILSLVTESAGQRVEAGLIGHEGFAPVSLVLGDDHTPYEGTVQMPLDGLRLSAVAFRAALEASATLRGTMLRFAQALLVQVSYTARSNAVHTIDERLARWILLCDDRIVSGELVMTHEFMSVMLGVRRPSVTTALHVLEGRGLVRAERGVVTVTNRAALETFAGDAYGAAEREYERLLGPMR